MEWLLPYQIEVLLISVLKFILIAYIMHQPIKEIKLFKLKQNKVRPPKSVTKVNMVVTFGLSYLKILLSGPSCCENKLKKEGFYEFGFLEAIKYLDV